MFKVAILQKRAINAKIDKNIETIIMAMEEASENHADILLLTECFITGYDLPMSYECFLLGIHTVRKVCGGYQPATAGF